MLSGSFPSRCPCPRSDLLTYRVPDALPVPPVGRARRRAARHAHADRHASLGEAAPLDASIELRDIIEVLDAEPFLPPDVVELRSWVADYYLAGPGAALAAAMPPHGLTARVDAFKTVRIVDA